MQIAATRVPRFTAGSASRRPSRPTRQRTLSLAGALRRSARRGGRGARVADRPRARSRPGCGCGRRRDRAGDARRRRAAARAVAAHCRAADRRRRRRPCVAVKPQLACFERLGAPGWAALRAHGRARRARPACSCSPTASAATSTSPPRPTRRRWSARRRRRSATSPASAPTRSPPTRCSAATRSSRSSPPAAPPARAVRARPHLQPGRGRRPGRAAGRRRAPSGSASPRIVDELGASRVPRRASPTSAPSSAPPRPSTSRALRELMPRTPFLLPGVGAQGGRVEDLAPAFAPGRAGGLVTASRSIASPREAPAATPAAGRPRRGRAPAGSRLVASGLSRGAAVRRAYHRASDALAAALRASWRRSRWWRLVAAPSAVVTSSAEKRLLDAPRRRPRTARRRSPARPPSQDLHGQVRRHALRDRGEDGRHARDDQRAQPGPRPAGAAARAERSSSASERRASDRVAAPCIGARRPARSRAPRRPPPRRAPAHRGQRAERDRHRRRHRRRRVRQRARRQARRSRRRRS